MRRPEGTILGLAALALNRRRLLLGLAGLPLLAGRPAFAQTAPARPALWAQPVQPAIAGLPNLHRVTDRLYRAAQPDAAGFAALPGLGLTAVLSLRQTVHDAPLAKGSGLVLHRVPMMARDVAAGGAVQVVAALRILLQSPGPVLVHCRHGADRTGLICALWRMLYQDWTRQEALAELVDGGFGFHPVWANIPRYLAGVDVDDLRRRVAS